MRRRDAISMAGALLLTATLTGAASQAENRGSIEGGVLRGETEDPASTIRVRLASLERANEDPVVVTTDYRGRFAFQKLQPGSYRLVFESDGYVPRILPENGWLKLSAEQPAHNFTVRLTPTGTISGRIVDRNGQPIGNVLVQLMNDTLPREIGTRSNDRGEYRFFFITPGSYWVSAGGSNANVRRSNGAASLFDEEFELTYFPGVSDRDSSRVLSVKPGEELSGTDIVMGEPRAPSVRQPNPAPPNPRGL